MLEDVNGEGMHISTRHLMPQYSHSLWPNVWLLLDGGPCSQATGELNMRQDNTHQRETRLWLDSTGGAAH
jgi:hypothetical protein